MSDKLQVPATSTLAAVTSSRRGDADRRRRGSSRCAEEGALVPMEEVLLPPPALSKRYSMVWFDGIMQQRPTVDVSDLMSHFDGLDAAAMLRSTPTDDDDAVSSPTEKHRNDASSSESLVTSPTRRPCHRGLSRKGDYRRRNTIQGYDSTKGALHAFRLLYS